MKGQAEQAPTVIIIEDDTQSQEQNSTLDSPIPRLRNTLRPDYTYQRYEQVISDATSMNTPSRKRKRTKVKADSDTADFSSILDQSNAIILHEADQLVKRLKQQFEAEKARIQESFVQQKESLQKQLDQLQAEKTQLQVEKAQLQVEKARLDANIHASTQINESLKIDLEKAKKVRALECSICYGQPDEWISLTCGHMFCMVRRSQQTGRSPDISCAICRQPVKGYLKCFPFGG